LGLGASADIEIDLDNNDGRKVTTIKDRNDNLKRSFIYQVSLLFSHNSHGTLIQPLEPRSLHGLHESYETLLKQLFIIGQREYFWKMCYLPKK
jgi:hypothetical protein